MGKKISISVLEYDKLNDTIAELRTALEAARKHSADLNTKLELTTRMLNAHRKGQAESSAVNAQMAGEAFDLRSELHRAQEERRAAMAALALITANLEEEREHSAELRTMKLALEGGALQHYQERCAELEVLVRSLQNRPQSLMEADNAIADLRRKLAEATQTTEYQKGGPSFDEWKRRATTLQKQQDWVLGKLTYINGELAIYAGVPEFDTLGNLVQGIISEFQKKAGEDII